MKKSKKFDKMESTNSNQISCVTVDTLIQTDLGLKMVSELIGTQFNAVVNGEEYSSTGNGFRSKGIRLCFEVKLVIGSKIQLTSEQKLLVKSGTENEWKPVKEISENDLIMFNQNQLYKWTGEGNFHEGYFCGHFIRSGIFKDGIPHINVRMQNYNRIYDILDTFTKKLDSNYVPQISHIGGTINCGMSIPEYKTVIDRFGIDEKMRIPISGSYSFTVGLLRGIFDGNSFVTRRRIIMIELLAMRQDQYESIHQLLFSLGIISGISGKLTIIDIIISLGKLIRAQKFNKII